MSLCTTSIYMTKEFLLVLVEECFMRPVLFEIFLELFPNEIFQIFKNKFLELFEETQ